MSSHILNESMALIMRGIHMGEDALGLDEAYSVKTPEDNRRLYAKWAATYESSFVDAKQIDTPKPLPKSLTMWLRRLGECWISGRARA